MNTTTPSTVRISREARIAASVAAWHKFRERQQHVPARLPFVTISRQYGCEAFGLAVQLADLLNKRCQPAVPWASYDREVLDRVSAELNLNREIVACMDGRRRSEMIEFFDTLLNRKVDEVVLFRKIAEVICSLATNGHTILVGRGSYLLTRSLNTGLHVRLIAPRPWRIQRIASWKNISLKDAEKDVEHCEIQRDTFLKTFFLQQPPNPFDLILENSAFNVHQMAEIIFTALAARFSSVLVED
ncbi:MAG: cytidylate kinase-like family protein [Verrucomicrobia bacterium]|nr:cytidylate kinase-like family protein [Verrucomicrobiota bacterium]